MIREIRAPGRRGRQKGKNMAQKQYAYATAEISSYPIETLPAHGRTKQRTRTMYTTAGYQLMCVDRGNNITMIPALKASPKLVDKFVIVDSYMIPYDQAIREQEAQKLFDPIVLTDYQRRYNMMLNTEVSRINIHQSEPSAYNTLMGMKPVVNFEIELSYPVDRINQHMHQTVYLADVDLVVTSGREAPVHPFSNTAEVSKQIRDLTLANMSALITINIVDNTDRLGNKKYFNLFGRAVEVQPRHSEMEDGIYIGYYKPEMNHNRQAFTDERGAIVSKYTEDHYTLDECDRIGLYSSQEEAIAGGDIPLKNKTEMATAQRELAQLKAQLEREDMEHKAEMARMKYQQDQDKHERDRQYEEYKRMIEEQARQDKIKHDEAEHQRKLDAETHERQRKLDIEHADRQRKLEQEQWERERKQEYEDKERERKKQADEAERLRKQQTDEAERIRKQQADDLERQYKREAEERKQEYEKRKQEYEEREREFNRKAEDDKRRAEWIKETIKVAGAIIAASAAIFAAFAKAK